MAKIAARQTSCKLQSSNACSKFSGERASSLEAKEVTTADFSLCGLKAYLD